MHWSVPQGPSGVLKGICMLHSYLLLGIQMSHVEDWFDVRGGLVSHLMVSLRTNDDGVLPVFSIIPVSSFSSTASAMPEPVQILYEPAPTKLCRAGW